MALSRNTRVAEPNVPRRSFKELNRHGPPATLFPLAIRLTSFGRSTAWRTDPDSPEDAFVTEALRSVWENQIVRIRTLGGSVPMFSFIERFHVPVVGVPIANADDNQHAENESLRLGNLWNGIVTLSAIMTR
jgi:hypothetical protein